MEQDVKLKRTTLFEGPKFDFEAVEIASSDGGTLTRHMVRHPGAVCICAILEAGQIDGAASDEAHVVLIRNTRQALGETLWELPAGTMEPPEPAADCAGRELVEEAGYEAGELIDLGSFWTTPGMTDERMHAFCARGLTHVGQRLEADERITVEALPVSRVWQMLDEGTFEDAKSIVTFLRAHRKGLV